MCFARDMLGMTPVHVAAMKGHVDVLNELLTVMPAAAREWVAPLADGGGGGTIMHLCVKYNQLEGLKLIASKVGDAEMLNAKDGHGNTLLHLAVANKQLDIVRFLLSDKRLMKNTTNLHGSTAMDIFKESHKDPKIDHQLRLILKRAKVLPSEDMKKEKDKDKHFDWLENQRSALMVVASLIATMAFQAATNPPGGASQDQDNSPQALTKFAPANPPGGASQDNFGKAIMAQASIADYDGFIIVNTIGLVSSMSSILLLISGLPCRRFFMALIMVTMWVAITAMTAALGRSLHTLTPKEHQGLVHDIIYFIYMWALVMMGLLLLGHVIWWTVRLLKSLGRLLKKLCKYIVHE